MTSLSHLTASVRLSISNDESDSGSVFGPGIAALCKGVRDLGSLNAAAKSMGMAYSKAWRVIKDTEAALGVQLLNRDGAHGSNLTDNGNTLVDVYYAISDHLKIEADDIFRNSVE